jgi:hypothetical protein
MFRPPVHEQSPRPGVATLEHLTVSSPPIEGVALPYGHLYGPATGFDLTGEPPSVHVEAAAAAASLAMEKTRRGIYNIAEPNEYLSTEKARRELGFDAAYRLNARLQHATHQTSVFAIDKTDTK